ncbi:DMT family transporter [Candidatus Woesearchaeota archaeon]|nr:DMT family transporter [Candidatus Woesearchaeota archaeon]
MILTGILCGLAAMLGYGISDYLLKKPSEKIGTYSTLFQIQVITLILNIPFIIYYFSKYTFNITVSDLVILTIAAIFDVFAWFNFSKSLTKGEIAIVTPIMSVYSIVTVVLSVFFLNEILNSYQLVAVFLALLGIILTSADIKNLHKIHSTKGVLNAFASMIGWGGFLFFTGFIKNRLGWLLTFVLTNLFIGIFVTLIYLLKKGNKKYISKKYITRLFMIALINLVAWFAMNLGFSVSYVSIVSLISSLSPVITISLGLVILKEKLLVNQKIGIGLIILSLVLIGI